MKSTGTMMALILIFLLAAPALADEALDKAAALAIVERLTSEARDTWVPAGAILARHQEYRAAQTTDAAAISKEIERQLADYKKDPRPEVTPELQKLRIEAIPFNVRYWMSNEYTMESSVVVRYDGTRFYWEINVESRTDSVTVPSELRGNYMTEQFNLDWNQKRVFAYDGQNYSTFTGPVGHAMVSAGVGMMASPYVNSPLTAGIVAWGKGSLTYENLSQAKIAAASVSRDGTTQIEMTVERANGSVLRFVLDPTKDYAVTSCSLPYQGGTVVQDRFFSGYRQIGGGWVPTTVLIEQRDAFTNRLLGFDKWDLTVVDDTVPGPEAFGIEYDADTIVQYNSPVAGAATFNYSNLVDTDRLLAERLTYVATKAGKPRNCATAALEYAAGRLGKSVADSTLTRLVRADGQTTLYDLKQAARNIGLHGRAVTTDIATLRERTDCVAILHLPRENHFVVLDCADDRYAWLVDLSSSRFYFRKNVDLLPMDWSDGVVLLLSDRPIEGTLRDIRANARASIWGAADGWSCTKLIQEFYYIPCIVTSDDCTGYFRGYYERYGCEPSDTGTCPELHLPRFVLAPCYLGSDQHCAYGSATFYYMLSCQ
jgi:hypothetical protein